MQHRASIARKEVRSVYFVFFHTKSLLKDGHSAALRNLNPLCVSIISPRESENSMLFVWICLDASRYQQSLFSFSGFWRTWERLCMIQVRSLLNMRGRLLGYSFEPRPNSPCACYSGLSYVHRFVNKWMLALEKKPQFDEREQDWLVHTFGLR